MNKRDIDNKFKEIVSEYLNNGYVVASQQKDGNGLIDDRYINLIKDNELIKVTMDKDRILPHGYNVVHLTTRKYQITNDLDLNEYNPSDSDGEIVKNDVFLQTGFNSNHFVQGTKRATNPDVERKPATREVDKDYVKKLKLAEIAYANYRKEKADKAVEAQLTKATKKPGKAKDVIIEH